jgi:hypothetical protein
MIKTAEIKQYIAHLDLSDKSVLFVDARAIDVGVLASCEWPLPVSPLLIPVHLNPGETVKDCVLQSGLVNHIHWYMGLMKNDEADCSNKKDGEFCAQCRERRRLRRELADILIANTPFTEEDLKDLL